MKEMLLPSVEPTMLIIDFPSTNLKIKNTLDAWKIQKIEDIKNNLMRKKYSLLHSNQRN